jgi:HPt (histidine-containing phosphotransfer) domain-containing protein
VEGLLLNLQTSSELSDNPERARQFREMLLQDINDEFQTLQTAFACGDRNDLGRAAHTLKGLCGYLANNEPVELAAWLQHNAPSAGFDRLKIVIEQLQSKLVQENNP